MNNYTAAIASFISYDVIVFNTLEYTMKKEKYDIEAYNNRKKIIKEETIQNTPLKNCLDNSGNAGKALFEKINGLFDLVYSENSSIVKVSKDGNTLNVDSSQSISVFESVLPIHEELCKIIKTHVKAAIEHQAYDEDSFPNVLDKKEHFYHGLVNMLMLDELDHQFAEYNKARNEANGGITEKSNLIQNDIHRLVKLFHFVRDNSAITNSEYYSIIDPLFALIEMTGGRRDLPAGKNFANVFTEVKTIIREKTQTWELAWKPVYDKFFNHFTNEIAKMQN